MKVYKVVLSIIDFDEVDEDELTTILEDGNYPNDCISPSVVEIESRDIGEWDDSHPLNNNSTSYAEFKRLFGEI